MVYVYLVLGICCLLMSGMWLGSIFTDNVLGYSVSLTQYSMTIMMFIVGVFQFIMMYHTLVLE